MIELPQVKIFLDSSVIIAALFSSTGGSFRLLRESRDGHLKVNILPNPKPSLVKKMSDLINLEDVPILAGAINHKADFLITLDRKDFMTPKLKKFSLPTIITTLQDFFQQYWK